MRLVFDRGTLLVVEPDPGFPVADLPGMLWDSRVGAFRCPASFHARIVAALSRAGVRYADEVPNFGTSPPGKPVELRPYQEAALTAWGLASQRGLVVLPTGSGKTRLALAAIARLGRPALCLVPTRVLVEQWSRAVRETLGFDPGRYGDGEHSLGPITVATFESAWRQMARLGNRFAILIVDEVHHFGGGMRDEALEMCIAGARLGLTATPPDGEGAARLASLIGPTLYELAVTDLVGEFLAPFEAITLHVDLDRGERAQYDALDAIFQEVLARFRIFQPRATWEEFVRDAGRTEEGRRALGAWRRARRLLAFPSAKRALVATLLARHHRDRTLVFTGDNRTAYALARAQLIMPLTCDIGRKERERALANFRDGRLRALVSSQVLNEGLDVPDADVGIVVAGHRGEREHVQRVGRLLRPRDGKRALVYDLVVRDTREVRSSRRRWRALAS